MSFPPSISRPLLALAAMAFSACPSPAQTDLFEKKIRPVLVKNCQGCHNPQTKTAGLDLSTAAGFATGGRGGPLVSKEDPGASPILRAISYEGTLKMPPGRKLDAADAASIREWVLAGATWPGAQPVVQPKLERGARVFTEEEKSFWAFQPVRKRGLPPVRDAAWVRSPMDAFVLARLEAKGLTPAPPADKLTLLRRVTYDLTGLPPSPEESAAFTADSSPGAFARVVDRLLASPRYGEHWGRHWLDVARYADSTGNDEDHRYPHAWRYRDYVIAAFNKDLPYNQFVREQIAGDLLPADVPGAVNRRGIVATGFLALGAKAVAQQDKKKMLYDVYDEQVDVTSRAFLGLTVACARCHDHKFDPILTRDYYALAGMFASTRSFEDPETHVSKLLAIPLAPRAEYERYRQGQKQLGLKNVEIQDLLESEQESRMPVLAARLADYMLAARAVYRDKSDLKTVAQTANLNARLLARWVDYLKPSPEPKPHLAEWREAAPARVGEVAREYRQRFETRFTEWRAALAEWRSKFHNAPAGAAPSRPKFDGASDPFFNEVYFNGPFALDTRAGEPLLPLELKIHLAALRWQFQQMRQKGPAEPDMACAVEEGPVVHQKVFLRGDYNNPGPDAPKAPPAILAAIPATEVKQGSGRRELADWIARPDHPLTARVMVNRIWLWHFGDGLVRTPDNFGKMGDRPDHAELLDFLANQFVERGWSIKQLHRLILNSSTYAQSAAAGADARRTDPENRLISRFERRRLSVEEMHDGLLAIDGTLDPLMGGAMQRGTGTDGENSALRLSVDPATVRRRLVYVPLRRANLPTVLNLFDFGDATTPQGKRPLSTVAPQALFMMNGRFVEERARNLAAAVLQDYWLTPAERIEWLHVRVLNRPARPEEVDASLAYIAGFREKFTASRTELDAWASLSRILIASNEFIYVD